MKYKATYLPLHQGVKIEEPTFDTEKEAREWINSLPCSIDNTPNCGSCQAEWDIVKIK